MIKFFAKSIIRKLIIHLLVAGAVIAGIVYFLYRNDFSLVTLLVTGGAFVLLMIYFVLVYYFDVVKPMRSVLYEMQALIAGKNYRRVYSTRVDEIGIIAYFFNQVTKSLGKVSFDIKDRERMMDELSIAAELQRDILPLKTPGVPGLQIVAKTKPATEVGGDSFNFITIKNKTYIYIGDVTGHGVAAGLVMTMVNALICLFSEMSPTSYDIVVNVNHYIKKYVKRSMFMTMVMLCWDQTAQKMTYVGAGHEHILVYRRDSGQLESLLSGGVALGMVPDNKTLVKEASINLNDGDFIILYTDGIIEARNKNDELYTLERLKQSIAEYASQYGAEGVNYHVAKDVSEFMGDSVQRDDMTLIVLMKDSNYKGMPEDEKATNW